MCFIRCLDHFKKIIDTLNFVPFFVPLLLLIIFFAVCSESLVFNLTNFFKTFRYCYIELNEGPLLKLPSLNYTRNFS